MPCLCGDLYCPSCGEAQGNARCYICGKWSADGGCDDWMACEQEERLMNAALEGEDTTEENQLPRRNAPRQP
jgi:hypothetical protein